MFLGVKGFPKEIETGRVRRFPEQSLIVSNVLMVYEVSVSSGWLVLNSNSWFNGFIVWIADISDVCGVNVKWGGGIRVKESIVSGSIIEYYFI